jgi:mycothiol system anti-sigma-R factor
MSMAELLRMKEHLDGCPDCSFETVAVQDLRRLLKRSCAEKAPGELRDRVAAKIAALRQEAAAH